MADKKTKTVDTYEIKDEKGNVEATIKYEEGTDEFKRAKANRESGVGNYFYKPAGSNDYVSTYDAKVDVEIDPVAGVVEVHGPEWLASEVINSDTFKQNYTENKALISAINLYRQNPEAQTQTTSGEVMSVADVIGRYATSAEGYASSFVAISDYKDTQKKKFGVNMTDQDVAIASAVYNKDDYDSNAAVYVPKWALNKYKWSSLPSWDSTNGTVSAGDFFGTVYAQDFDNNTAQKLQEESLQRMMEALDNNVYDHDSDEASEREAMLADEEYISQLARTMQMYSLVTQNKPEVSNLYKTWELTCSTVNSLFAAAQNVGLNLAETMIQIPESIAQLVSGGDEESAKGFNQFNRATFFFSPAFGAQTAAFLGGELLLALGEVNDRDGVIDTLDDFMEDFHAFVEGENVGATIQERHEVWTNLKTEYDKKKEMLTDWWSTGEFVGDMAWKIVENIKILNPAGAAVEGASLLALGGKGLAKVAGKSLTKKGAALLVKGLAKGANVTTQAVLETMLDDKQLINKAIASGEMTGELWDKFVSNWVGNGIAEIGMPMLGKGSKATMNWWAENFTTGKIAYLTANKIVNGVGAVAHGALKSFFAALNGVKADPDSLSKAIFAADVGSATKLGLFNVGTEALRAEMSSTIAKIPIFKEVDETLYNVTNSSYAFVFGGARYMAATTAEEAQAAIKEGVSAAMSEASEEVGEAVAKEAVEGATKEAGEATAKEVAETTTKEAEAIEGEVVAKEAAPKSAIEKNYETMKKNILLRANLENQLDAITKGAILQWQEIKKFAGKKYDDLVDASSKVAQLEQDAISAGKGLHQWGAGTALSRESAEYISLKSQLSRYTWKLQQVAEAGSWKEAFSNNNHRLFNSAQAVKQTEEAVAVAEKRLAELSELLGTDLVAGLDELLPAMGKFHASVMQFMGVKGYITKEDYVLFRRLINDQGWGAEGEFYVPTVRLTEADGDIERGFKSGNAWMNKDNKPVRRMTQDNFKELTPGADGVFGDPLANLWTWSATQAKIAQAQEWARAIHAVSAPYRAIKGFNMDGITQFEASVVERSVKELDAAINEAIKGANFKASFDDALLQGNMMKEVLSATKTVGGKAAKQQLNILKGRASGIEKRINNALYEGDQGARLQTRIINNASDGALDNLVTSFSKNGDLPVFNPNDIDGRGFRRWYGNLPDSSKKALSRKLAGQEPTLANLRTLVKQNPDVLTTLKRNYIKDTLKSNPNLTKDGAYRSWIRFQYDNSAEASAKTVLNEDIKKYSDISDRITQLKLKELAGKEVSFDDLKSLGKEFNLQLTELQSKMLDDLEEKLLMDDDFKRIVKYYKDAGVDEALGEGSALRYLVLHRLSSMSEDKFTKLIMKQSESAIKQGSVNAMKKYGEKNFKKAGEELAKALKSQIDSDFNVTQALFVQEGFSDVMDMGRYFGDIQKQIDLVNKEYSFSLGQKQFTTLNDAQRSKIVEMVGPDGQLRFYQTSPLYATLVNEPVGSFGGGTAGGLAGVRSSINQLFRWGTTGIDKTSYINQWFRDPINAVIIGGYRPFLDITTGGIASKFASAYYDMGLPFGRMVFGKLATTNLTEEYINATFESIREGLIYDYGQEWYDGFTKEAVGDLEGAEASQALKRATVQFATVDIGYGRLPGLGGIKREEFFRASKDGAEDIEEVTAFDISRERASVVFGERTETAAGWKRAQGKFQSFMDKVTENTSKGGFREEFLRKGVYASQYRVALQSGMTHAEARTWATRYALDATTNFNRTFMWGNDFIRSVPYLGAAVNGAKSFWRLVEMDPIGVTKRLVFGLCVPYARMLTLSLSSEENREAYKNVREYEKEDSMVFVWKGQVISIPAPQELSSFLAPFRHMVEKAADVQDNSWIDLATSDILGILPLDMSGFVNLDGNDLLAQDGDDAIWNRISRGAEKAASGVMDPITKSIYMLMSGRDPYTGREIDTSYVAIDDEGNRVIMDSTQSALAKLIHEKFPDLSASAANTVLKTLLGRSTLTVLDGAYSILDGSFEPGQMLDQQAAAILKPLEAGTYNKAKSDWQNAVNQAFKMREELINNEAFQKAYQVANNTNYSEEKRKEALTEYRSMLDEYCSFVLGFTKELKAQYPAQYTNTRMAQVLSLLTLPTGLTFNDTDYSAQVRQDAYYDSRNVAVETFLKMGFPADTANNNALGTGRYNKYGEYEFKVFTPYEIEYYNSAIYGTDDRIQASIEATLKAADINKNDMWAGYYAASDKAERKEWKDAWNLKVARALYPIFAQYSPETVLNSGDTVDLLDNYIFVDNPYKTKQYIKSIFEVGEE